MTSGEVVLADGRVVTLTDERWRHIVDGHPELQSWRDLVLTSVAKPERIVPSRRPDEEWRYGRGGPSRAIKVVVEWKGDRGAVVTAFARRRLP